MAKVYFVLVCYDIAHPKRLRKVAQLLEEYGNRVQKSVFECGLTPAGIESLTHQLNAIIDTDSDNILIQPICRHCQTDITWQGKPPPLSVEPFWIV